MSKTNFKCMFLIDDKLYKKAILKEESQNITNLKTTIPNSVYLNPVPSTQQTLVSDSESMKEIPEKEQEKPMEPYELANTAKETVPKGETLDKEQQVPILGNSKSFAKPYQTIENGNNMETDQNNTKDDDCECYDQLPVASTAAKRGRKRKIPVDIRNGFASPVRKKEYKKRQVKEKKVSKKRALVVKPTAKKTITQGEEIDYDQSDESDWEELRERYRKLRGDYDSPPRRKEYKKRKADKNDENKLRGKKTLSPIEYFEEGRKQNKLKKSVDDIRTINQIKMAGAQKRKLEQDLSSMKIPRREFVCKLCQSHYKTKSSLQRHNANIHGDQRGSKRSKSDDEKRYVKRQKNNNLTSVSYLNYF